MGQVLNLLDNPKRVHPRQRNHENAPVSAGIETRRRPVKKRIQASMRTRQTLPALIEGRLSSPDARADLVKPATRLIVEEALEAESRDAPGLGRIFQGPDHPAPDSIIKKVHSHRPVVAKRPIKMTPGIGLRTVVAVDSACAGSG